MTGKDLRTLVSRCNVSMRYPSLHILCRDQRFPTYHTLLLPFQRRAAQTRRFYHEDLARGVPLCTLITRSRPEAALRRRNRRPVKGTKLIDCPREFAASFRAEAARIIIRRSVWQSETSGLRVRSLRATRLLDSNI